MADTKLRIVVVTVLVVLSLVIVVLGILLRLTKAFFIPASILSVFIFVVVAWTFIRHAFLSPRRIGFFELTIVAAATSILTTVVTLSTLRYGAGPFVVAASVAVLTGFLFVVFVVVKKYLAWKKKMEAEELLDEEREEEELKLEHSFFREAAGLPTRFRYRELKAATEDFKERVGRGGSGSVFRGVVDDLSVAVKRIDGEIRGEKEFKSEVTAIMSVQHINLVRILGYCLVPRGHRFLVYEFFENGSLDGWIFPGSSLSGRCLPWSLRYQVAIDVAKALAYLHHDCRVRILHLDVKPENILLDDNFRARVTDFGISRMMEREESKVLTTVRGTRGYLAPEWFVGVGISEKCDVYSYGMVLLELVGGRRNASFSDHADENERRWSYYPKNVSEKLREGKVMEAVDERMMKDGAVVREEDVRTMVYVALWCIQERPEMRPSMELVLKMLQGYVPVSMPPETKMFMVDLVLPVDGASTSTASAFHSSSFGSSLYTEENSRRRLLSLDSISVSS